jgi:hypothetical protein
MDTRTAISFGLSFCLVAAVAVALRRPDHPPRAPSPPQQQHEAIATTPADPPQIAPAPTPGVPWPATAGTILTPKPILAARKTITSSASLAARSRPTGINRGGIRRPKSAFTTVEKGESLADVACRVYGSEEAKETLWLANRDELTSPNGPLRPGSSLRTP